MLHGWRVVYGECGKHYTTVSAGFNFGLLFSPDANELARQIIGVPQEAADTARADTTSVS
ncbi:hypothetical protein DZF91_13015 [Actinomadura logoneensis]|uniref:Uncharacterized protein n=2 Tax=Actinomadura logoneensis TaxID=2293572 RepID=A0A372JMM7_9ACTN|nr:hypothetical protein DZF91_13015 [Actinomadura logoneensis]